VLTVVMNLKFARKALTKPIWWLETRRDYPIRDRIYDLPSQSVCFSAANALMVLTTPGTVADAAWCAYSFILQLPRDIGLVIMVDGTLAKRQEEQLEKLFPGVRISTTAESMTRLASLAPALVNAAEYNAMCRKATAVCEQSTRRNVLYCDADVLCFAAVPEISAALGQSEGLYIQDIVSVCTDPVLVSRAHALGYRLAETLNCGLLYLPKERVNLAIVNEMLDGIAERIESYFVDTTIIAVLMEHINALPLPREKYVVSNQRQFYFEPDVDYGSIAVRHFTTPVRHLMYGKGMPILWERWTRDTAVRQ
jgi:hypothetical protein